MALDYFNSISIVFKCFQTQRIIRYSNCYEPVPLLLGYSRRQSGLQKAMREKLHWLRITDRINYKNCASRHQVTYIERV